MESENQGRRIISDGEQAIGCEGGLVMESRSFGRGSVGGTMVKSKSNGIASHVAD